MERGAKPMSSPFQSVTDHVHEGQAERFTHCSRFVDGEHAATVESTADGRLTNPGATFYDDLLHLPFFRFDCQASSHSPPQ